MDWIIGNIPAHPLLVHAVVVLVPLAAIAALAAVAWPTARKRLGVVMPILASAAAVSAALAIQAGEALEESVKETALVEAHTDNGETVVPWLIVFVIAAWAHWAWFRFFAKPAEGAATSTVRKVAPWVIAAVLVVSAVGGTVQTFVVGHSGAEAVWSDPAK